MELFKFLKEKAPFLMAVIAIAVFYIYDHYGVIILATLIYIQACRMWIVRSEHRRNNFIKKTLPRLRIPQPIYEWYPYVFLAGAMTLVKYIQHPGSIAFALLLTLVALKTLFVRHQMRSHRNRIHY